MRSYFRLPAAALAAAFFVSASIPQTLLAQAPSITATKTDSTPAATKKAPGATVTYTNTITNSGTANATNVNLTDPNVSGATVVAGSLKVSPIAFNDTFTGAIAPNTTIDTSTATQFSVTTNDYVGVNAGAAATITITAFDAASANGGVVSMTTSGVNMGKFVYTPAPGYVGADSFRYTVTNSAGLSNTGVVGLTVTGPVVWYVSSTTGDDITGKGTLTQPFASLNRVLNVDAAGHKVFVFSGTYNGTAFNMETGETLVGQGVVGTSFDSVVLGMTPTSDTPARPSINGTKPAINGANANGPIRLGEGSTILGVSLTNVSAGYALSGTNINAAQIGSAATSDVTLTSNNVAAGGLLLNGGSGNISVNATITTSAGRSVTIQNRTGGTVTLSQQVTDTATGVSLTSNFGATINFSGGLSLSTGANTAFTATGGGVVNVTQNNTTIVNTITTTSGGGLLMQNTVIGNFGLTFRSITSGAGANNGITLDSVGVSAGLTVTGNGSAGSGGTIAGKTGADGSTTSGIGIYLNTVAGISLAYMDIQGCENYGIRGNSVIGFNLSNSTVGTTTANGTSNTADLDVANNYAGEGSIRFFNLSGTATIANSTLDRGFGKTVAVVNNTGTLTSLTINASTLRNSLTAATSSDALYFQATGASTTANLIVNGASQFTSHRQNAIQTNAQNGARMDISISGSCVFKNTNSSSVSATNLLVFNGTGTNTFVTFDLNGNTFTQGDGVSAAPSNVGRCLTAGMINGRGTFQGKIRNNTFGVNGIAFSGAGNGADAIGLFANGANGTNGPSIYLVQNNIIQNYGQTGVQVGAVGVGTNINSSIDASFFGNTIRQPGTVNAGAFAGIWAYAGNTTGDTNVVNLAIGSSSAPADKNTLTNSDPNNAFDVFLGNVGISTAPVNVYRNGSGSGTINGATEAQVNAVLAANNVGPLDLSGNTVGPINILDGFPSVPPLMLAPGGVESASAPASASVMESGQIPVASAPVPSASTESALASPVAQTPAIASLTQAELDSLVATAIEHWTASGLTAEQHAFLRSLTFEVTSLPDMRVGEAAGRTIRVDADAGGSGWFVGTSDALFDSASAPTRFYTNPTAAPAGRVDLLTTLMHEMGHALGLPDSYSLRDRNSIMYGHLTKGERRYPAKGEAAGALPFDDSVSRFLSAPVGIGVLPPGKSVTIIYDVVISDPPLSGSLSSQGTVSGSNFASVLTDDLPEVGPPADPALPGAADPTVTLVDLPDVTVAVSPASRLEDSGQALTYTFTRTGGTGVAMTVNFALSGTASASTDFTVSSGTGTVNFSSGTNLGTVIIPSGSSSATALVVATSDTAVETDETVIATVTAGTTYDVGTPAFATGTIANDDAAIAVAVAPASVNENSGSALTYTFTRTGYTGIAATANFTVGGTATLGGTAPDNDYTASGATTFTSTSGTVDFAIGDTIKTVTVTPVGDTIDENDETVILTMAAGTGYVVGGSAATGTLTDDDLPPVVSIANPVAVTEGNSSITTLSFPVSLNAASAKTITVQYASSNGTALTADSDYVATSGTLTFNPGETSKTVDVTVNGDTAVEPNETVLVTLSSQTNSTLGTADATGTINNDDVGVSVDALPDTSLFEDQTINFAYTFRRSGVTTGTTVANFTVGGTSTFSADYTQSGATTFTTTTGSVTFAPGETTKVVTLDPAADNAVESNETIILTVTTGSGYTVATPTSQTATLVDDDVNVSVAAAPVPASTLEDSGTAMVYTFTRSGGSVSNALTVNITLSGTAVLTTDYDISGVTTFNPATGAATIRFAGGAATKTFTVTPITDTTFEPDETVILTVVANGAPAVTGGYTVGANATSTGTITDDDLPLVSVSTAVTAGDNDAVEGGVNNGLYTFTRNSTTGPLTVDFQLDASSTAVAGTDFTLTGAASFDNATGAGTVTFANGVGTATVTLAALTESPNGAEAAETARLNVVPSTGVYGAGASPNATVTINANSFLVNTTADGGTGSLRQAVANANTLAGTDTVTFDAVLFATPQVITLTSGDLVLTSNLTIQGTGASLLTISGGNASRVFTATSGTVVLTGLTVTGGNGVGTGLGSGAGGGVFQQGSNLTLRDCVVAGNTATFAGGGIFCSDPGGSLTLVNCTISGNTTATSGGGVWLFGPPSITNRIVNSTISGNTAGTFGGGVGIVGSDTSIINTTLSGNNAGTHGGGLSIDGGGVLLLSSSTVTGNRCDVNPDASVGNGGGIGLMAANFETFANTIVAGNFSGASPSTTPSDIASASTAQTINTASNNLIGNAATAGGITNGTNGNVVGNAGSGTLAIASILNTTLANNGGATATHALVSGSPALNAGSDAFVPLDTLDVDGDGAGETIDVDQRGATFIRAIGTLDIGSYELQKSVSILADAASKAEGSGGGNTAFTFTVSRTGGTSGPVTLDYAVTGSSGTPAVAADFGGTLPSGQVTILDAATTATVTINVLRDAVVEADEAFTVTLSNPNNGYAVSGATASSTITDDDTATVTVAKTADGTEGGTNATFRLSQTAVSSTDTVVNIAGTGTATSGTDYTALGSTATIVAGQTTADVTIAITDDRQVEGPENVILTLTSMGAGDASITLGTTVSDTAAISDNDTATLGFTSGTGSAAESVGTQNVGLTLTLNATGSGTIGLASNLTANLTSTGGTATDTGTDYTLPGSPAATFTAGTYATGTATQNASVSITDDRQVEGSETAVFGLSIATNIGTQVSVGGTTAHTLTLTDNDTVTLGFTSGTGTVLESAGTQSIGTTLTITATGAGTIGLASNVTAALTSTGGTATGSGTDYTLPASPAVTFTAGTYATGSGTQSATVSVTDDRLVEGAETAALGLSIVSNIGTQVTVGGTTAHTLTLTDNDSATLGFTSGTGTTLEGQSATVDTTLTITATGTGTIGLASNLTANLTTTGGTATGSGTDYTLPSSPALTFAAGSYATGTTTQSATVTTVDDRLGEGSETAGLGLSIAGNIGTQVSIGGTTAHTLTITDNDTVSIGFTAATGTALENVGTQNVSLTLTLVTFGTGPISLASDVTASLNSSGGFSTATGSGTDYTLPASPAVTFSAGNYPTGSATQNAAVPITDDRLVEGNEITYFGLVTSMGITGPTMNHALTITDNDTATLGYTSGTGTVLESAGTQSIGTTLTITATGTGTIGLAADVTANLTTTGGTATGTGTDYTLPGSPAVTFAAGTYATGTAAQNATVSVTDDRLVEGPETAALGLSIATNIGSQVSVGGTTAHTLTLTDNDTATLGYTLATSTALESAGTQSVGTTLTINATGTGTIGLASGLTANFTTTGGTASGSDYTLPTSPALTYAAGTYATGSGTQSASVTIANDQTVEANETVGLGLSIATNIGTQVSIGGTAGHTLTITDNDTATITLSPVSLSLNEGTGGGSTSFTFTATASNAVQGGFSVDYATSNGTALAGSDYTDNDGTLTFAGTAGESQTITVAVTHDGTNELDEDFTVSLGAFGGTTLGASLSTAGTPATGTILNDDLLTLSIAATDASADENTAATGTWRITRNGVVGNTTVQLHVDATSSAVAADWTQSGATFASLAPGSTGTAIIPAGVTFVDITLTPLDDIHAEADENAVLRITTDAAYTIGTPIAPVTIGANDFVVINASNAGEGTLRQAVANANTFPSNDVITFATPQAVVLTSGELLIQNNGTLTILGDNTTSISGNNTSRVFNIGAVAQVTLRGLWIKDGNPGSDGGAILNAGGLDIISSTLSGNAASAPLASGGAIFNNSGAVAVVNSTLSNNSTTASGGAIHNSTGIVSVVNSTISTNTAGTQGGGLFNDNGSMTVDSATVTANSASTGGGGLYRTGNNVSLYNSIIAGNTTTSGAPDLFAAAVFDANNNLIGVNTGHPLVNGTDGNIVGTAGTPANALLGPLANNGGPTLTHMLLDGSPAINAGDSGSLPADFYDVDGDLNTAETLPLDQRGTGFVRVIGTVVDLGSYEAFAFRPALTATTVDEDTLSSTGLVLTPNTADGGLTTAFKITNIQNGTLYQNDGTTEITTGTFLTLTQGAAGLKFKPALNLNSPVTTFGFDAQATVDGADTGLRTGIASASITVTPVNDAPTVVAPGLADQTMTVGDTRSLPLPAIFADVDGDTLTYTVQANSDISKATATINGTNVDLAAVAAGVTNITIQASDGNLGGTVTDIFQVAVGTVNPTPTPLPPAPGPGGYPLTGQTGTYNINTSVTNTTAFPIMGFRLTVDYSAYLAAYPSLRLFNATNAPTGGVAYIDYPFPVAVGGSIPIRLDFYTATRTFPNPFAPVLTVTSLPVSQPSTASPGPGIPATIRVNAGGQILLEWASTPGQWYEIRWSDNMTEWYTSTIPVQAAANKAQWIDSGAPFTRAAPGAQRFYIVNPRAAPTP